MRPTSLASSSSRTQVTIGARAVSARPVPSAALGAELRERLILYGALTEPESGEMIGVALALQAPGRDAVEELLGDEAAALGAFPAVEVHDWEFGGRR